MIYPVSVENCSSKKDAWTLCVKFGLKPAQDGSFKGTLSQKKYAILQKFCRKAKLRYCIEDSFGERGDNYRKTFFYNNKPHLFGMWFCAYCGKPLTYRSVTVDHIIPVGVANKDLNVRKWLKRFGYESVNDPRNLVASCRKCNQKKGTKIRGWVLQGHLGRRAWFWYIRHAIRIIFIIWLVAMIFGR